MNSRSTPTKAATGRVAGKIGLAIGLLVALAANLTYSWPFGPVLIGAGVICPVILPIALWIRSTFTVVRWLDRLIRDASVVAVAGPAAALSYQHTYMLMSDHGVPHWLAALLPLSADGIAALSTLALHRSGAVAKARRVVEAKAAPQVPVQRTVEAPPPSEISQRGEQRAVMVEWIRRQDSMPPIKTVAEKFGVHATTAKRARADARAVG